VCERLVEKANEHGGPDNITVLLARIDRTNKKPGLIHRVTNLVR
jgi:serine/threonine protein phosphatase PrpC